jgi:hypothetical protein
MGNLRDQLKKAQLLSDQEARRLAHEARVERKVKGHEAIEQEQASHRAAIEKLQADERGRTAAVQAEIETARRVREELAAAAAILANEARKPSGAVKWYFTAPDGSLPCLEVSPREVQELRAGMLCVVRSGPPSTHDYRLLPAELCKRVGKVMPAAVVHAPRGLLPG